MVWSYRLYLLPSSSGTLSYPWFCCHCTRYAATIKKIDYDKERVLVHYHQWSHRHDEWFQWNSSFLRPLERVSLRKQRLNPPYSHPVWHRNCMLMVVLPSNLAGGCICICWLFVFPIFPSQGFASGMKVLACWTDCRFYPAKILSVNRDGEENVFFFFILDGLVLFWANRQEKSRAENWRVTLKVSSCLKSIHRCLASSLFQHHLINQMLIYALSNQGSHLLKGCALVL